MWLTILGLIPGALKFFNTIATKAFDAKVALTQARIGGDRDVAVKLVQAQAAADHENTSRLSLIASNKFLTLLLIAFALPLVGFEWKVIIYDKMLGWGSTDPITGQVGDWAQSVIYFLFGSPTVMAIGKMWFSRNKTGE